MDQNELRKLIDKYLAGQCTEEEIKLVDQWYDSFETNQSFVNLLSRAKKAKLEERLFNGVNAKITASQSYKTKKIVSPIVHKNWFKAAASIAFIIAAYLVYFFIFNATIQYATAYTETKRILLPDGSSVVLNANTAVTFKRNWNHEEPREVWLEGEAFFEVQKLNKGNQPESEETLKANPEKIKFIVHTPNLDVEVLGTSFNVNHRRGKTQVVLNSGKVEVKSKAKQTGNIRMKSGELVELSYSTNALLKKKVNPADFNAWQHKKMIFKSTPLSRVAEMFQDYYGIKMLFKEKQVEQRQVTGSISIDNIELFLEMLSASMQLNITRTGDLVWVESSMPVDKE